MPHVNTYLTITIVCAFVFTVVFERLLIPRLKSLKMGQRILDIGPRWHKSKEGTPTMGGLGFIAAAVIAISIACAFYAAKFGFGSEMSPLLLTLALGMANGAIGIVDDLTKFKHSRNEGLTAKQKILFQLIVAALYLYGMTALGHINTELTLPFTEYRLELGIFYYVFALILIVGMVNSVNLTDGLDGLASCVTLVIGALFAVMALAGGDMPEAVMSGAVIGSAAGFLVYNYYPARVFMGDTGSLFYGGLVSGLAFMTGRPLIIVIAGFIYILEAVSVMLQVMYFKATRKRLFKMAPIHHHFEKSGLTEVQIVFLFTGITVVCCLLAWFAF